jgi:hypothetical protein
MDANDVNGRVGSPTFYRCPFCKVRFVMEGGVSLPIPKIKKTTRTILTTEAEGSSSKPWATGLLDRIGMLAKHSSGHHMFLPSILYVLLPCKAGSLLPELIELHADMESIDMYRLDIDVADSTIYIYVYII